MLSTLQECIYAGTHRHTHTVRTHTHTHTCTNTHTHMYPNTHTHLNLVLPPIVTLRGPPGFAMWDQRQLTVPGEVLSADVFPERTDKQNCVHMYAHARTHTHTHARTHTHTCTHTTHIHSHHAHTYTHTKLGILLVSRLELYHSALSIPEDAETCNQ